MMSHDHLLDGAGERLGIAEAAFNNAHRRLIALEEAMKRGEPFKEAHYNLLMEAVEAIPANYAAVMEAPYEGAADRPCAFAEVPE